MGDLYQNIGQAAGKIYQTLEKKGSRPFGSLQKDSGISDGELFQQAIGWLAREGKLEFQKKGKVVQVALSSCGNCCGQ